MSGILDKKIRDYKEAGMVAIMVTMVLMIVISLIVLGFAQISRRNQRQALDRQLSTQAFYAAETGINDASELIKAAASSGSPIAEKPDCDSDGGGFYASLDPVIDSEANVEYTCLLVDPTPTSLVYNSVGATGTIIPLIATGGTISSLEMVWQSKDDDSAPANACPANASGVFAASSAWTCGYGVLRFDLVPTAGSSLSISSLQNSTMTSFLVPIRPGSGGTNSVGFAANGGNNRVGVSCDNTDCNIRITGLGQSQYYMRVNSIYKDVSLQIRAFDGGGNPVGVQGAQAVVDATGKAEDVLRRVQVRVPLIASSTNLLGDHAIQSAEAVCKRFSVMDGFFESDAGNAVSGVSSGTNNPFCE